MRLWFGLIVGMIGVGILVSLGIWQVQRLAWKEDLLARIESQIAADPVPLGVAQNQTAETSRPAGAAGQRRESAGHLSTVQMPELNRYSPVTMTGSFDTDAPPIRVLASRKTVGAVYRIIRPFQAEGYGRILVDTGWIVDDAGAPPPPPDEQLTLVGNLDTPNEADSFTPAPDLQGNIWFARDVPEMARALSTEPVLVVLRETPETDLGVTPWPVDTAGIPNDHLQYAITWFSLAVIWGAMTVYFLLRTRRSAR
ncbi:SURF1 family protein [Roseobacter sinensis]|uniref:SURF1-like protein n=1 Tax=Roseobacter sinensis TaxID=2931391 RepID=A0ABT3BG34_9RHOB|nr:SURF1 family protein [Roseobacter sp. WL0113]MCV3272518.1 SURF1 family protein [Roseobacter sp. WL0113]